MFAQDPQFAATDEEFLRSLGIEILCLADERNAAHEFHEHASSTFLYAPFMQLETLLEEFLATEEEGVVECPAVFLGPDMRDVTEARWRVALRCGEGEKGVSEGKLRRLTGVVEGFNAGKEVVTMPEFELHDTALDLAFYFQREGEETEDQGAKNSGKEVG
ncbi:hypothetical protein P152DRAFT_125823 [Eremomyces bilateralis CBS 781.70]|uniref:SRR1-like domain-containing protein n=1 Tax=Eremomyces bilateralis CBS 781.70 TaxID=1392243 RepID=A0A6G1GEG2_9PEZI|nr:uncharacterized protein P152DRAFT_125823 [Eremomyces bilateralis CBS 781.70]KAF1816477.1 hypothetical protein P152DRAFT_125823 [Eremomyces bilateralis CBS 781.70]